MTSEGVISSVLPTAATTSTLGIVKPDGNTITITADGTISAAAAASGLIGKSMVGYNQPTSEWGWIADWAQHPEKYYVVIEGTDSGNKDCPVIYTTVYYNQFYYYWFEDNILHNRSIEFTDNTLSQVKSVSQYSDSGVVQLTQNNWQNYISISGNDWQHTTGFSDSDLYNAKELILVVENQSGNKQMGYFNFSWNQWSNGSNLGSLQGYQFYFDSNSSSPYFYYDGNSISLSQINNQYYILYKT